jgi:hypothetical protein
MALHAVDPADQSEGPSAPPASGFEGLLSELYDRPAPDAQPPDAQPEGLVTYSGNLVPMARARRRAPRKAIAGLLTLAVVAAAIGFVNFGPGSGRADAAVYRRLFTPKEKHSYQFRMGMRGTTEVPGAGTVPMNMAMSMRVTERTLSVDEGGTAVVLATLDKLRATIDGKTVAVPGDALTVTSRVSTDGTILNVRGLEGFGLPDAGLASDMLGPQWMGPLLPPGAIAPGDTWTVTERSPTPFGGKTVEVTANNRLLSLREVGGVETAVIKSAVIIPLDLPPDAGFSLEGSMTMDLVQTVERATSRPISVTGDGRMVMTMSVDGVPGGNQRATMTVGFDVSMTKI